MRKYAALSFTEPPPLQNSALAKISQPIKQENNFLMSNSYKGLKIYLELTQLVIVINCKKKNPRCVCETQMPPIMANSIDGLEYKDKYFDTSKKILSQE